MRTLTKAELRRAEDALANENPWRETAARFCLSEYGLAQQLGPEACARIKAARAALQAKPKASSSSWPAARKAAARKAAGR